jgi:orotidine-5'-phosphate decarboxylase
MNGLQRIQGLAERQNSLLCIGLDPDPDFLPTGVDAVTFCKYIVAATKDLVCAYKINLAFWYTLLYNDPDELSNLIWYIVDSNVPVIADAKFGDIANTAKHQAKFIFECCPFDAVTVNAYCGFDGLEPFFAYTSGGVFVVCATSNAGGQAIQPFVYKHILNLAIKCNNQYGNVGLVVGCAHPEPLLVCRAAAPDMPILVPGVGAQNADLFEVVRDGENPCTGKLLVNVGRSILYASKHNFDAGARAKALEYRDLINKARFKNA